MSQARLHQQKQRVHRCSCSLGPQARSLLITNPMTGWALLNRHRWLQGQQLQAAAWHLSASPLHPPLVPAMYFIFSVPLHVRTHMFLQGRWRMLLDLSPWAKVYGLLPIPEWMPQLRQITCQM